MFYPFYSVLQITALKNGQILSHLKMAEGEEFTLSFIHSVNRRPVYDTIRVEKNYLVVVKSRFDSLGGGMPEVSTDKIKLQICKDGWLEGVVNCPVPEITFFVGWVANHSLQIRERNIPLTDLAEPGTLLSLRVRKASHYDLWKNRCIQ